MCLLNTNETYLNTIMAAMYNLHCDNRTIRLCCQKVLSIISGVTYCIFLPKIRITQEKLPHKTSNENEHTARIAIEQL